MGDNYIIKHGISQYPVFHYKELDDIIKSKSYSETETSNIIILKTLRDQFEKLTNELKNIIHTNLNNFNIQSKLYNRNTYNYLVFSQLDLELSKILIYKLSQKNITDKINENENNYIFDKNKIIDDIKNKYENNNEINKILVKVGKFLDKFEKIYNSNHSCAMRYFYIIFNYLICYMKEMFNQLNIFKNIQISENNNYQYTMDDEIILIDLIFMLEKLDSICIFLSSGYFVDKNDIFNQSDDSDDWKNISRIGYEVISSREEQIQKEFKNISLGSERIVGAILNSYNEKSYRITNGYYFLYKYIEYGYNQTFMLYESKKEQLIQNRNITKEIMEIVLWPTFKKLGERDYEKIAFRKKMYVKKEYPDITLDNIQKLLKAMGNKSIDVSNIKQEIIYKDKNDIINNKEISKEELYKDKVPKNIKKYYSSITLLHSSYITFPEEKNTLTYSIMNSFFEYNKPNTTQDAIMLFIHGGGYVGMSTRFHECFLRDWVNQLNIPIIGINYGLSPKHKYPYALNDVYQAYRWIMNHCEDVLGIKNKKLILAGDSSGGGLALSLLFLLIAKNEFENENIRLPDLMLLLYPCCNTSTEIMGTSVLLSIKTDCFLLNDKFLLYVNEAYRDIYPNDDDPFLNPAQAKECILKKMPKSVWQFGTCDPLRDDIIRLLAKISKNKNADIKAYQFREYNHGFIGGKKNEFLVNTPYKIIFKEIRDILKS